MGIDAEIIEFPEFARERDAVVFQYTADSGRLKGERYTVGISFQEEGYPEYPPHFIHVRDVNPLGIAPHKTHTMEGRTWHAFSLPPLDIWDTGTFQKNMRTFKDVHMRRVWDNA